MAGTLDQIYARLPVWAQHVAVSLYGVGWRRHRLGGRFQEHVAAYRERDRWSSDRMREHLTARLREQLVHAFREVPLYRRSWGELGVDADSLGRFELEDLRRLPVLPKSSVRSAGESLTAEGASRGGKLYSYLTSGSSGTPVAMRCTADEHREFIAVREVRSFGWAGTSLLGSRSMIGGRMVVTAADAKAPYHRYNIAEKQLYLSAFHISRATATDYVAALNHYQPECMTGYAYAHYILGRFMLEEGISLKYRPKALVLSSEKLTSEMRGTMEKAFGAPAFEEYGAVENCMLATQCEAGRLHVQSDFGILEVLDDEGRPAEAGVAGRIVCTSLVNRTQPLIRYEIGDVGVLSGERCSCGRDHLPVLKEVVGRLEDTVVGPDGREMVRFHGLFVGLAGVTEAQVVQEERAKYQIKVVAGSGFGSAEEGEIVKRMRQRLGSVEVAVSRVPSIPRTRNGKFRAVISLVQHGR